ncbi:MAG TPA: RNA-binding protein [Candidatus Hydrogenedentes bacterium]|nr:RNA-binding protein [Candidatus Hydrogenedentota bacterium]HQE84089.1 RNA-binding protein [Candidatus Hydrogenedentota bacterium]HQH52320.1 RNA-binding protein [Candidatus Hydrogenedentota bacterium]HQM47422.1 RNA-binding protein [Candidatus Hydrogenedentota bacterium]
MNIYVGNLSYTTTDDQLRQAFEPYGTVSAARVVFDRVENRSRGFGFVEMPNGSEAKAAIEAMNGADMQGRALKVNEARPKEDRRSRY